MFLLAAYAVSNHSVNVKSGQSVQPTNHKGLGRRPFNFYWILASSSSNILKVTLKTEQQPETKFIVQKRYKITQKEGIRSCRGCGEMRVSDDNDSRFKVCALHARCFRYNSLSNTNTTRLLVNQRIINSMTTYKVYVIVMAWSVQLIKLVTPADYHQTAADSLQQIALQSEKHKLLQLTN